MKILQLFFSLTLISGIGCACSDSKSPYHDQVVAAAKRDAYAVADAKGGTMEREKAVLAIRVREHSLRTNGLENEADLYIETAGALLIDSLQIIEVRAFVKQSE